MPFDLKNRNAVKSAVRTPSHKASEAELDLASPERASNGGRYFKENINTNKSETLKLNVEPLPMKRKKRGGGYNLRNSLAWDRAFFTEEGVLDPLELSVISGASCRELPVIDEGTQDGSQLNIETSEPKQLEPYHLKGLPSEHLSNVKRIDYLSEKAPSSSSKVVAPHKISTRFGSTYVSRNGDRQSLPSSSLKRPATANASEAAAKELKLPKVPGSVPGFSSICDTKSSILRTNRLKHNQIAQPGLNICSKSLKNQTAKKPSSLRPTCRPEQNSGISSVNRYSKADAILKLRDNVYNSRLKDVAADANSSRPLYSPESQGQSITFAVPFPQNIQSNGRVMHHFHGQSIRPSGLRMPSPSLSFFGQPKASAFSSLSSRDAVVGACGFQKPGISSLQDSSIRKPKIIDSIIENINNSSNSIRPRSRCFMPYTTNVVLSDVLDTERTCNNLVEDNKFVDGQTNDLSEEKGNERIIARKDTDFQEVDNEIPPQNKNRERVIDGKKIPGSSHSYTVKGPSLVSGWRNLETIADENTEIHRSEPEKAIDEQCEDENTFNVSIINSEANLGTQREDETDYKLQEFSMMKGCKKTCNPSYHEPFIARTDECEYVSRETNERCGETMGKTTELLGLSQLPRSSSVEVASYEALEQKPANVRSSGFGSDFQEEEDDSVDLMTDEVQAGEVKNRLNLLSGTGEDSKVYGKDLMIQDVGSRIELDLLRTDEYHTSDGLLSEKQTYFQMSHQEEIVDTHPLDGLDRNGRNKLNETNMGSNQPPVEMPYSNFDEVEVTIQTFTDTEPYLVDNSPSLIHRTFEVPSRETKQEVSVNRLLHDGNCLKNDELENVLLHDSDNENLPDVLYLNNGTIEMDHYSSFPKCRDHEVSQNNAFNKVTHTMTVIKDDCRIDSETFSLTPQEGRFDIDSPRNILDSRNTQLRESETNRLNERCMEHLNHLKQQNVSGVDEKLLPSNDGLHIKDGLQSQRTTSDESLEDYSMESMFATVAVSNDMYSGAVINTNISAHELSSKTECFDGSDGSKNQSYFVDSVTDPASTEPFLDSDTVEIPEETNKSTSEFLPKSGNDKVKSALAARCNEKSHACKLPLSTIPFSDEWLAAIEAAGEEILTRKGGAVQNSPPDKPQPEPSPWSPVKKKTNQIGPYDCTKFSNKQH